MASVHVFSNNGTRVRVYAIDHSVGRGGANRMDDVQLIQVLINRYIAFRASIQTPGMGWEGRVTDNTGQQIAKLRIDGRCGPLTLNAILATQRALDRWRGCAVDGRIDALKEGGQSAYRDGTFFDAASIEKGRLARERVWRSNFNTMYILAVTTGADPNRDHSPVDGLTPWDNFSLPDPLKSSLIRSSVSGLFNVLQASI